MEALYSEVVSDQDVTSIEFRHDMTFFRKNILLFPTVDDLRELDRELAAAIRKAVADELGPFDDVEIGEADGEAEDVRADDFDIDPFAEPGSPEGAEPEGRQPDVGAGKARGVGGASGKEVSLGVLTEDELVKRYGTTLSEYFTNREGTVLGMKIYPTFAPSDVERSKALVGRLQYAADRLQPSSYHPAMEWMLEGSYHKKIDELAVVNRDIVKASIFALVLILIVIIAYFGRARFVLFVFVPLVAGIAWTMGTAWLMVGHLNLVTALINALMFGLGVDFGIHVTDRYIEERGRGLDVAEACVESLSHLGRPMFSAALTTTVAFLCLVVFDFRGFSHFGLIAGVGVPVCLGVVFLVFPPMAILADRLWKERPPKPRIGIDRATLLFDSRRTAALLVAGAAACFLWALSRAGGIEFEHQFQNVMTQTKEVRHCGLYSRYRKEVEDRSASPILLLTDSRDETRKVHRYLDENRERFPRLEGVSSIFKYVPDDQDEKKVIVNRMKERLERKMATFKGEDLENARRAEEFLDPRPFRVDDLPEWVQEKFTDADGRLGRFVLIYARGEKSNAASVGEILEQFDSLEVEGKLYDTSASYYILRDAYDIVRQEGPIAVLLAFLAVLLILIGDFRNWREIAASTAPLVVAMVCLVALMASQGTKINMFNMVVLPTILGLGIDTSTHLLHRVRQEGADKLGEVANTTGCSAALASLTTAIGFGSFATATNPGLVSIGTLAPLGIAVCFVSAVVLTCAMVRLWPSGGGRSG
jgi:predicted RND superfamily exporter protein